LLVLALAAWLPALRLSLWTDEAESLSKASSPDLWAALRYDVHPPLYHLLLRVAYGFTSSIALLRLTSMACAVGLLVLAWWVFRRTTVSAMVAGLLAALSPEILKHAAELRAYALLYLLLGAALALAVRLACGEGKNGTKAALALVLAAAVSTHLVTLFFLAALVPLLLAPVRSWSPAAWVGAAWPVLPAFVVALLFKFTFIIQPRDLPGGWWVAPLDCGVVLRGFADATGWSNLAWLGQTLERKYGLPAASIPLLGFGLVVVPILVAWRAGRDRLGWLLLSSAAVYALTIILYSLCFEPVILARTVLPGLLPLFAWLAWGIGRHASGLSRRAAIASLAGFSLLAMAMPVRLIQLPPPGLREMTLTLRAHYRTGDILLPSRTMEAGLLPYWPDLPHADTILFQIIPGNPTAESSLVQRLDSSPPPHRVWLIYRDDYYTRKLGDRVVFERLVEPRGYAVREIWRGNDLFLLLAEMPPRS
jgi:hypothetical protein